MWDHCPPPGPMASYIRKLQIKSREYGGLCGLCYTGEGPYNSSNKRRAKQLARRAFRSLLKRDQ